MNNDLFLLINGWAGHSSLIDGIMVFFAKDLIYVVAAVAVVCAGLLIYHKQWRTLAFFAGSMVLSFILLKLAGTLNVDHRPFMDHHVTQLIEHAPGKSFPSDHTTASTAIAAGILFLTAYKKTGAALIVCAVLIGFSRIFVGVHYPADILGGLITGLLGGGITYWIMHATDSKHKKHMSFDSH
jgi:undecaprenyl-diphosphatase